MAVDQEQGAGYKPGSHAGGLFRVELRVKPGVELDEHETLPGGAVALGFGLQFAQEGLFELEDIFYVHAGDEGLGSGNGGIGEDDVLEFVAAGGENGGTFVDFGRIEQIEHGKMLPG